MKQLDERQREERAQLKKSIKIIAAERGTTYTELMLEVQRKIVNEHKSNAAQPDRISKRKLERTVLK